ncbi:MAG: hypothetical protein JW840_02520 [Candidatus Thermoplasmatota archaeon]|nr:hypothetical protein [Candidatus Thermoplasmatota archaeon]
MNSISNMRNRYRPQKVKYLLIGESPPKCDDENVRFFYNPEIELHDNLFKSVMRAVFPTSMTDYQKGDKGKYLVKFQSKGFYLIDATDIPVNKTARKERREILRKDMNGKIGEIEGLISIKTPIFLITRNVDDIFHEELERLGYDVTFLPFPCRGYQKEFINRLKKVLTRHGYRE